MSRLGFVCVLLILFYSCSEERVESENRKLISEEKEEPIAYFEFSPDTVTGLDLYPIQLDYAYEIDGHKIVVGYYGPLENGEWSEEVDASNDWGDRLFLLNGKNEIVYKSRGVGDPYLFEPHFYKNAKNGKVLIICQLGYEYRYGGEAFVLENDSIVYIGNLNVESIIEEVNMTDIVIIHEENDLLRFTFNADSVMLNPAGKFEVLSSKELQYIFENDNLRLEK